MGYPKGRPRNPLRIGKFRISFELLGELLMLPEDHKVINILCNMEDISYNLFQVFIEGPMMPLRGLGRKKRIQEVKPIFKQITKEDGSMDYELDKFEVLDEEEKTE